MLAFRRMASAPRAVLEDLAATAFVKASTLFRGLDPEALHDLLQLAEVVDHQAGEVVAAEADETFLLLVEGSASARAGGGEFAHLERGATFGEAWVLGAGRPSALVARSDVTVVTFPVVMIAALCGRFPRMRKLLEAVQVAREKEADAKLPPG
jgi:CRP-like cAMP-binding protein